MAEGQVKVEATDASGERVDGSELEAVVDKDLEQFEGFFCGSLGNDGLSDQERAIIKTYLWWKTHPGEDPHGT